MSKFYHKSLVISVVAIFLFSFLINLTPEVFGAAEFSVSFIEIGKNGILSKEHTYIRIEVENSVNQHVSGATVSITNPSYISPTEWDWEIIERETDYLIKANKLTDYSIKEDFTITFTKTGFNTKEIILELSITSHNLLITDEFGVTNSFSDLEFAFDSFPPNLKISNRLQTVFVGSEKYFVLFAWQEGFNFGKFVISSSYQIVSDPNIYEKVLFAEYFGTLFGSGFTATDLTKMGDLANSLKDAAIGADIALVIRTYAAQLLGFVIKKALIFDGLSADIPDTAKLGEKIVGNAKILGDLWLEELVDNPYPYITAAMEEITSQIIILTAINRLDVAGDEFYSLQSQMDSYVGTTYFEYTEVQNLFDLYIHPFLELVMAAGFIESYFPSADLLTQVWDITVDVVKGHSGKDLNELLGTEEEGIGKTFAYSLSKYVSARDEFYAVIQPVYDSAALITLIIYSSGSSPLIQSATAKDDFSITSHYGNYASSVVVPGNSIAFSIFVEAIEGSPEDVTLSCTGQDYSMTVSFSPQVANAPFTSTLTVQTTAATFGAYTLEIVATSGIKSTKSYVNFVVTNENLSDFSLDEVESPLIHGSWIYWHGYFPDNWVHSGTDITISVNFGSDDIWWTMYDTDLWENPNLSERDQFTTGIHPVSIHADPTIRDRYGDIEYPININVRASNHGTLGQQSNMLNIQIIKAPTWAVLSASSSKIYEDESVIFNGNLCSSYGVDSGDFWAMKGTWVLEVRQNGGEWSDAFTDSVSAEWRVVKDPTWWGINDAIGDQVWTPPAPGLYEFRLSYGGEYNYEPSVSEVLTVNVMPTAYPITVTINGLPASQSAEVSIDEILQGTQNGESSLIYPDQSIATPHIVAIEPIIEVSSGVRYVAYPQVIPYSESGEYIFNYQKEYELTTIVNPEDTGRIAVTGDNWLPEGVSVEANALTEQGFSFDYWNLNSVDMGDESNLVFNMDSPIVLQGIFIESDKELGYENSRGWYWGDDTEICSTKIADVDLDGSSEVVTAGYYFDGERECAQLAIWDSSTLGYENVAVWYWDDDTRINSIAISNLDEDVALEIVTGGYYYDGVRKVAQIVVWDGATLAVEADLFWYWTGDTVINSILLADVDGDGDVEIVTGGSYNDGVFDHAQITVWDGETLAYERDTHWQWLGDTQINSLVVADVDDDSDLEVVTGGYYNDGVRDVAQVTTWNGANLAFEDVAIWYWNDDTRINSIEVVDVDDDTSMEVVTGGYYFDGVRDVAQITTWSGVDLSFEDVAVWYWTGDTRINSIEVADVDSDSNLEVVTGGYYNDGTRDVAQLATWNGADLSFEDVAIWYWTGDTCVNSIVIGNTDGDIYSEIITGGYFYDGTQNCAQTTIWQIS